MYKIYVFINRKALNEGQQTIGSVVRTFNKSNPPREEFIILEIPVEDDPQFGKPVKL